MGGTPLTDQFETQLDTDRCDKRGERYISGATLAIAAALFVYVQAPPGEPAQDHRLVIGGLLLALFTSGAVRFFWAGQAVAGTRRFCALSILDVGLVFAILGLHALQMGGAISGILGPFPFAVLMALIALRVMRFTLPPVLVVSGSVAVGWGAVLTLTLWDHLPPFSGTTPGDLLAAFRATGVSPGGEAAKLLVFLFVSTIAVLAVTRARRLITRALTLAKALQTSHIETEQLALHDPLTGLPNRRFLDRIIAQLIRDADLERSVGLIHVDLDRFKPINDTYGHRTGDMVLRRVADILRSCSQDGDLVARIGGDEFVVLRDNISGTSGLEDLARTLVSKIAAPIDVEGRKCRLSASLGYAATTAGLADTLIVNADLATYQAKQMGRNCARAYSSQFHQEFQQNSLRGEEVLNALEEGEFLPYFQPAFNARTGILSSIEVLARWKHPEKGAIGPHFFLSTARELRVLDRLDREMVEKGLLAAHELATAGLTIPELSFNISQPGLEDLDWFMEKCQGSQKIVYELSDANLSGQKADEALWLVTALRDKGAKIALDGFGGVNGSITSLLTIRPDKIKLDPKIIRPMPHSEAARKLVKSLIDIATSYKADIVAVGVETAVHAGLLKETNCAELQGHHFARPMSQSELLEAWKNGKLNATTATLKQTGS
ncbi:hypothetical protein GCM10011316_09280 [Roseibium aquae]|uniref:Diguanylate cyclase (GGDEF)-like protein n=1 Tax=Roseibium aquae TaxID=1323746 RepID=A0A916TDG5_9HYPH|nr:EAL domain-containing protein [Roseibium aquae]GGB39384.1 hypothetical protein GCM10011316_09280 [Roseibium aquae]